jgi:hypothetical protein
MYSREISFNLFEPIKLVRPMHMIYRNGQFECTVEVLKGNRYPYTQKKIEVKTALEMEYLYIPLDRYEIQLIPLIKYSQADEILFFNGSKDGKTKWICYHETDNSEISDDDDRPLTILSDLFKK